MQIEALKRSLSAALLGAAIYLLAGTVGAEVLDGRVVGVMDGDTVKVLVDGHQEERVRLAGIDTPERAQPFGAAAKQRLSDLVYGRQVAVHWHKRDRYGRIVGTLWVSGDDAGLELLKAGLAWHYKRYAAEQPPDERARYATAETTARDAGAGLWADPDPVPPWDWRRR